MPYIWMELVAPICTAKSVGNPPSPKWPGPILFPEWDGVGLWKRTKTVNPYMQLRRTHLEYHHGLEQVHEGASVYCNFTEKLIL